MCSVQVRTSQRVPRTELSRRGNSRLTRSSFPLRWNGSTAGRRAARRNRLPIATQGDLHRRFVTSLLASLFVCVYGVYLPLHQASAHGHPSGANESHVHVAHAHVHATGHHHASPHGADAIPRRHIDDDTVTLGAPASRHGETPHDHQHPDGAFRDLAKRLIVGAPATVVLFPVSLDRSGATLLTSFDARPRCSAGFRRSLPRAPPHPS